jgi:hypothetical protein
MLVRDRMKRGYCFSQPLLLLLLLLSSDIHNHQTSAQDHDVKCQKYDIWGNVNLASK